MSGWERVRAASEHSVWVSRRARLQRVELNAWRHRAPMDAAFQSLQSDCTKKRLGRVLFLFIFNIMIASTIPGPGEPIWKRRIHQILQCRTQVHRNGACRPADSKQLTKNAGRRSFGELTLPLRKSRRDKFVLWRKLHIHVLFNLGIKHLIPSVRQSKRQHYTAIR